MRTGHLNGILLFLIGGGAYVGLELLWRNYSHWTMFVAGGICFTLLLWLNDRLTHKTGWGVRCLLGSITITAVELGTGIIVNLLLGWQVWDYSAHRFHFMGQISLTYSVLWFFLSAPVFLLGTRLQHILSHIPELSRLRFKNFPKCE